MGYIQEVESNDNKLKIVAVVTSPSISILAPIVAVILFLPGLCSVSKIVFERKAGQVFLRETSVPLQKIKYHILR